MSVCLTIFDLKQTLGTLRAAWYLGAGHLASTGTDTLQQWHARWQGQACVLQL